MDIRIKTKYGEIEGIIEDGLNKWLGVPFAKPPVGNLRFRRARECETWAGLKECKTHGNKPVQFSSILLTDVKESEDCLYLNIWRPDTEQKLPVFVWIYGGGYSYGECSDPIYDGSEFAKSGVLYVAINYRVGVFGFYDFTIYDKENFDSNCGFSDQLMALKWIKENISDFGGDPQNITIAGESAGGASVCNMLAAPLAKGLFQKAISQSALPDCVHSRESAKKNMDIFLAKMNIEPYEVSKLKYMEAEKMKASAQYVLDYSCEIHPGIFQPGPVIDDLLPESSICSTLDGSAREIKLIIGTNHDEGSLFMKMKWFPYTWEMVENMCKLNGCMDKLQLFHDLYDDKGETDNQLNLLAKDRAFLVDAIKVADGQSKHNDVWMYRFDYAPEYLKSKGLNAMHSVEIPIALGTSSKVWHGTDKKDEIKLRREMQGAWINFAKTGNPNSHLDFEWNKYDEYKRMTYIFDKESRMEKNPEKESYEAWKDVKLYK